MPGSEFWTQEGTVRLYHAQQDKYFGLQDPKAVAQFVGPTRIISNEVYPLATTLPCALNFALLRTGKSIAARIAMMAMSTSSSINVNPPRPVSPRRRAAEFQSEDITALARWLLGDAEKPHSIGRRNRRRTCI